MNKERFWHEQQWRMAGMWEPKMFLLRRGDSALCDIEEMWRETHSDEYIARLKSLGINLCHIHFHKGYGLEHERESIAEAQAFAERLHANGIRVGVYIGCTFFFETFSPPQYDKMIMQNSHTGWSGAQYFRQHWCHNSPHAREYFQEVIRVAIEEVEADVLHFDTSWSAHHHLLCHCEYCIEGFGKYLREECPELVSAAGYDRPELLSPPPAGNNAFLATLNEMREPGAMAWLMYHTHAGVEAMRFFVDYARGMKPEVAILFNGATLCGITPFARADDALRKVRIADCSCFEDSLENPPGMTNDGMPISRFRPYKAGLRAKCRMIPYTSKTKYNNRLMMAESAAFNYCTLACLAMVQQKNRPLPTGADEETLRWLVEHEELFLGRTPWHHVAVLRHQMSEQLNPFPCGLTPYVVEQILFERHVPFATIGRDELNAHALAEEFNLLILPDCKCLSDQELAELSCYVKNGGRLLSIGNTSTAAPLNQFRGTWGLGEIFAHAAKPEQSVVAYEEIAESTATVRHGDEHSGTRIEAAFGKGLAVHIPALKFHLPDKDETHSWSGYDWYYHPYWRMPKNADVFHAAFDDLLGENWRLRTTLPRHVGVECFTIADGFRLCFVNYADPRPAPESKIAVRLSATCPDISTTLWHTFEGESRLEWETTGRNIEFSLPSFDALAVLSIVTK